MLQETRAALEIDEGELLQNKQRLVAEVYMLIYVSSYC
jgi:hypothetical protein